MSDPAIYFSYSIASELIRKSPKHAWLKHNMLGGRVKKPTPEQLKGTAIGSLLLGKTAGGEVQLVPFDNYRTKEAQTARDAIIGQGGTPVTLPEFNSLTTAAEAIRANLADLGIQLNGESEVPFEWVEGSQHGPVRCRGKVDHVDGLDLYELKSTSDASADFIGRQIVRMGYDIQHAAYRSAFRKTYPDLAGRERFTFLFFELDEPYSVTPVTFSGSFRAMGNQRWSRAVETWARCLSTNQWPHYADQIIEMEAPTWAIAKEDAIYDQQEV